MSFLHKETPATLDELFQDALVNNTFSEPEIMDTVKNTIENSYSYLYRLQRNMIRYQEFKFQTREKYLTMSRNDLDVKLKQIDAEISFIASDSDRTEEEKAEAIKKFIKQKDDLVRIEYGDLYLDEHYRVCMDINFDLCSEGTVRNYRDSIFFDNEFTFDDIIDHPEIFRYLPIFSIDGGTYFDLLFRLTPAGELKIITPYRESFLYNLDHKQRKHDIHLIFVDNIYADKAVIDPVVLTYYETRKHNQLPFYNWPYARTILPGTVDGLYFGFFRIKSSRNKTGPYHPYQEIAREDPYFTLNYDRYTWDMIHDNMNDKLEIYIIFFHHAKKYLPYNSPVIWERKGKIPLVMLQEEENKPYPMPIPEVDLLLLKRKTVEVEIVHEDVDEDTPPDIRRYDKYLPPQNTSIKLHYPNIYEITDPNLEEDDGYRLYYFYEKNYALDYTPISHFYFEYLKMLGGDVPIEQFINMLYYGNSLKNIVEEGRVLDSVRFKEYFDWVLKYREANQEYSLQDFLLRETWTRKPINYQTNQLKKFILKDYDVLRDYAKAQRTIGNVHHLYVHTVDLKKRLRYSTAGETNEGISFFQDYHILDSYEVENPRQELEFLVVDNEDVNFDSDTMIKIRDFCSFEERPEIGDTVRLIDVKPMYLFLMKGLENNEKRHLRMFIDGLYNDDFIHFNYFNSEFLYIPSDKVKEDSYIMIEEMEDSPYVTSQIFQSLDEEKVVHIVKTGNPKTYMTDLYLLDAAGFEIPNTDYTITPVIRGTQYNIQDKNGENKLVHASVASIQVKLKNAKYLNQRLEFRSGKHFERYKFIMWRRSWPRFTVHEVISSRQLRHLEVFHNGRVVPQNLYRLENYPQFGIYRVQMLKQCEIGDELILEFSPYSHKESTIVESIDENYIIHLNGFVNKPCVIDYYDFYLNGRRLGLPHVYQIGATSLTLVNIKSDHFLEIRERERDDEYFGFEIGNEVYYADMRDFMFEDFVNEEDRCAIIRKIIDSVKDPRTVIKPNTVDETPIWVENLSEIEEETKIFYYEDFCPKGLIDSDMLQFNNEYLQIEYPRLTKLYLVGPDGSHNTQGKILYLDPDINADKKEENTIVMLTGENEIND